MVFRGKIKLKMKNIITSAFLLLLFTSFGIAQSGNQLEFNQVILVSSTQTVPANKVWKVESALGGVGLHNGTSNGEFTKLITVNGNSVVVASRSYATQSADGNQSYGDITRMPFWLPEGSTIAAGSGVFEISILEFNVVPN